MCRRFRKLRHIFSIVSTFYQVLLYLHYNPSVYGDYSGSLERIHYGNVRSVLEKESHIEYTIPYYFEEEVQSFEADLYAVDRDFWQHTEYELVVGKYPETQYELLCDTTYLYRYHLETNDMIGYSFSFHGREYTVCGLYRTNRNYTTGTEDYNRICFTALTQTPNACIYRIKDDSNFDIQSYLEKNGIRAAVITNWNDWTKWQSYTQMEHIIKLISLILIITTVFIINHAIILILIKHRKHIDIFRLIGLPAHTVKLGLWMRITVSLIYGLAGGCVLYVFMLGIIFALYKYIAQLSPNEIVSYIQFKPLIRHTLIYIFLLIIISILLVIRAVSKSDEPHKQYDKRLSNRNQPKQLVDSVSASHIAKRHVSIALLTTIGTSLILGITITTFLFIHQFFRASSEESSPYVEYDYKLSSTIDYTMYTDETPNDSGKDIDYTGNKLQSEYMDWFWKQYRSIAPKQIDEINRVLNFESNSFSIQQLQYQFGISKLKCMAISDHLRKYLIDIPAYQTQLLSYGNELELPYTLIALTKTENDILHKQYFHTLNEIPNGKCIISTCFTSELSDQNQINFHVGDTININHMDLEIISVIDRYNNPLIHSDQTITLLVNPETYRSVTGLEVLTELYIQINNAIRPEIEQLFKSLNYLDIKDLSVSAQVKRLQICQKWIYSSALAFLIVFILFCIILVIYLRCIMFENEYSVISALGLPASFSYSVINKEIQAILIPAFCLSLILLTVSIYAYNSLSVQHNDFTLQYPLVNWFFTCMIVELAGFISAQMITMFMNKNIIKNLRKE